MTLNVDPGETINTELNLRNISSSDLIVSAQINDFVASGEDGTPKILLDEEEMADNPYSFREWVAPMPEQLLVPQEVKTLPITIEVPEDASPGGHYGVVRFSANAPELDGEGVSLSASLGTLMLVTVSGDTDKSLEIEEFSSRKDDQTGTFFESAPLNFLIRLRNTGNTHVEPRGQVTITDMFGRTTATLNVNLPPRNILPESIRAFNADLDGSVIGDKWLFGRYTADLNLEYDDGNQTVSDTITFWVIPYRLIALGIVALIAAFFALRAAIKRYNQRIIENAKRK